MKKLGTIKFLGEQCDVLLGNYPVKPKGIKVGAPFLKVTDEMGMPMATASVNMPDVYHPQQGEVIIKDWSENAGIYKALKDAGIVGEIVRKLPAGYCEAYVCKLLKE